MNQLLGKLLSPRVQAVASSKLTVAGLIVGAAIIVPQVVANYWVFLITAGCLTAITAMGLSVIIGWVGEITLAGGAMLGTSVYITGYLLREGDSFWNEWPFLPAIVIGMSCVAVLSAAVAIPTVRFSGIYVMVLTMGLQITLERTLFSFPWIIGGFGRNVVVERPRLFGIHFDSDFRYFYVCLTAMLVCAVFLHSLRTSRHGRAMNLLRTDARAAAAVGISPWKYKIMAFAVGGALVGVAGAFTAPLYRSPPAIVQFILFQSLFLLAIPIVAGTQTIVGIIAVSIAFQLIPTALEDHSLSPYLLGGIGLLAGTIVGPRGMGGTVLDLLQTQREVRVLGAARTGGDDEGPVDSGAVPA